MSEPPAYHTVAAAIRADITSQRLVDGDQLPTVRDLATRFDVPTGTITRALDMLRGDGIIATRHGKGLYVRSFARIVRRSPARLAKEQWGNGRAIQDHDTQGRLRVKNVVVGEVPAPDWVGDALQLPAGAAVLSRARRFAVDDRVVQTATSYLPLDVAAAAPSIAYTDPGPGGIYNRLAEAGLGPQRFTETLVCRLPTPGEVAELVLPGGTPVIALVRYAYTGGGRCVEVNTMVLDASAYQLEYEFTAEP